MKYTGLLILLLTLTLQADYVKETVGACKDEATLSKLEAYSTQHALKEGGVELELLLIKNNCILIDKRTKIEVLDYTGKQEGILKLVLKETGEIYFSYNKGIQIEQPGQDNLIYIF